MTGEVNPTEESVVIGEDEAPCKRSRWPIAGIVIAILLVAAAFMAGRLMRQPGVNEGPGGAVITQSGGGPSAGLSAVGAAGEESFSVEAVRAPELPQTEPDAMGLMTAQRDNSIFISIANEIMFGIVRDENGETQTIGPSTDGPKLEIVVGPDTKIYRDTTRPPADPEDIPEDGTVQQTVELLETLPALPENTVIHAWGQKTGDRLLADVLFFSSPFSAAE
jgi:hypothetical protein